MTSTPTRKTRIIKILLSICRLSLLGFGDLFMLAHLAFNNKMLDLLLDVLVTAMA
ncbi:hypothetical protein NUITMVRE36_22200 [Enterococcus raffinosus]|nr:hypothetical protein NUITMVRE36_22200 [Enterococcus raffinosus]